LIISFASGQQNSRLQPQKPVCVWRIVMYHFDGSHQMNEKKDKF